MLSIRYLLAILLLSLGVNAAAGGGRTMDYAWLLFLKVNEPPQIIDVSANQDVIAWPSSSVLLNATAIDDPRDTLTYEWVDQDGFKVTDPFAAETTVTFTSYGTYDLEVIVSDGKLTSSAIVTVTYNNSPPIVNIFRDSIETDSNSVPLSPEVTDNPSDNLTYTWRKESGLGTVTFSNPNSVSTTATFSQTGTYVLKLEASDGEFQGSDTVTIDYLPQPVEKIDSIVAVGDSITVGLGDNDCTPGDTTAKSCSGYTPKLKYLLDNKRGYSHTIWEDGKSGETSSGGRLRISSIIAFHKYHDVDQYIVMYGTNDANPWAIPIITPAMFKYNMQQIINAIKSSGAQPILARIPYAKSPRTYKNAFYDGSYSGFNGYGYNDVIDDLQASPPDFYDWFKKNPGQLNSDGLHPNHDGYWSMARIWRDKLTQ